MGGCRRCCEPRAREARREARCRGVRAGLERTPGHAQALSHAARLVRVRARARARARARVRARVKVTVRVGVRVRARVTEVREHLSALGAHRLTW